MALAVDIDHLARWAATVTVLGSSIYHDADVNSAQVVEYYLTSPSNLYGIVQIAHKLKN